MDQLETLEKPTKNKPVLTKQVNEIKWNIKTIQ